MCVCARALGGKGVVFCIALASFEDIIGKNNKQRNLANWIDLETIGLITYLCDLMCTLHVHVEVWKTKY